MADRGSPLARRDLRVEDLARLAGVVRLAEPAVDVYRAVEELSAAVIGHRLFTIMRVCPGGSEVERAYSSMPAIYPVGGRKTKKQTPWAEQVLREMKIFRAVTPEEIRAAFDDHPTILGLGFGSVLNIPIVWLGRCLGTMNLLHDTGWYSREDEGTGLLLATFLIPGLLEKA
jgi:hypothetical protein